MRNAPARTRSGSGCLTDRLLELMRLGWPSMAVIPQS